MISIITASFNSAKTIEQTIQSVLAQTFNDYEYIIIDGASSDNTVKIIESYADTFKGKLKFISEQDKGIYDAWNKGLRISKGEWICFVGSDDILYPDALENYNNKIKECNKETNYISAKVELVTKDLKPVKVIGKPWSNKIKDHCVIAHVGSIHKRELFEKYGDYSLEYKICSDYEFLLRNFHHIVPAYIDNITAKMRMDGISNSAATRVLKETLMIKNNNSSFLRKIYNYLYFIKAYTGTFIHKLIKLS